MKQQLEGAKQEDRLDQRAVAVPTGSLSGQMGLKQNNQIGDARLLLGWEKEYKNAPRARRSKMFDVERGGKSGKGYLRLW